LGSRTFGGDCVAVLLRDRFDDAQPLLAVKQRSGAGGQNIPVVTAAARIGDMTIYLNGLGCVPNSTITAKSRVDDQLIGALFQESQLVSSEQLTELQQHVILDELYSCLIQPI
jgi:hypothetical protein